MRYIEEECRPSVLGARSIFGAVVLHALFFGCCWILSMPFREKELVIPIDLTFEAPPTVQEDLPKPEPKPVVKPKPPEPDPPKVEETKQDAVVQEPPKKKPPKKPEVKKPEVKKPEVKKPEPKKIEKTKSPEPPKKSAAELRKEQLKRMRDSTTKDNTNAVKSPAPSGTGNTLDKNWQQLMGQGYKPGATTQLAASETQRCISLIRQRFYEQWEQPAWTSSLRVMYLEVTFTSGGKVASYRLVQSSGDGKADRSVISAAGRVTSVPGLSADFLAQNKTVRIDFKVTPQ